jgi:glycosyltransferase involved in cell wall biosynthesis
MARLLWEVTELDENSKTKREPLVSIAIPTYNEEKSLPFALESVSKQTYSSIETLVIDSDSTDRTKKVASNFGSRIFNYKGKLLGARYMGLMESKGEYIFLMDADQVLERDSISRAVDLIMGYDMLVFGERAYQPKTYIQKKLAKERNCLHKADGALDPLSGGLLPRFFKKELLIRAFGKIPSELFPLVVAHDHAIIYYEVFKLSQSIGILPDSISHIETESFSELITHEYRFGKSTKCLKDSGHYGELLENKNAFQARNFLVALNNRNASISFLRSLAYQLGYCL